jgi:hypothetical protein
MHRVKAVVAASVLVVVLGLSLSVSPAFADPSTFSPSSNPFGTKFKEWTARWWQFVVSFTASENPLLDATGQRCAIGQAGPVWLLMGSVTGTAITRDCAIPEGTALLFPVINFVNVNTTNETAEELRATVAPFIDEATGLTVSVDGEPLSKFEKSHEKYRIQSAVFSVTLPPANLFGLDAGTYSPAIDDGFYVMLKPLEVGHHTLRFTGQIPSLSFSLDVTYHLEVVATTLE